MFILNIFVERINLREGSSKLGDFLSMLLSETLTICQTASFNHQFSSVQLSPTDSSCVQLV